MNIEENSNSLNEWVLIRVEKLDPDLSVFLLKIRPRHPDLDSQRCIINLLIVVITVYLQTQSIHTYGNWSFRGSQGRGRIRNFFQRSGSAEEKKSDLDPTLNQYEEKKYLYLTVCPRSSDPFYKVSYYIKWVSTSCTHTQYRFCAFFHIE